MKMTETTPAFAMKNRMTTRQFSVEEPAWLSIARQKGMAHFTEVGIPTTGDENWRFTNVAPVAEFAFEPKPGLLRHGVTKEVLADFPFETTSGSKLVFVNGIFAPELSVLAKYPNGVKVTSLASGLPSDSALFEKHLFHHARTDSNAFAALNAAYFQDGAFIYVPENKVIAEPIHLLFVSSATNGGTVHPRNLIVAERGSQVTVLETFVSLGDAAHFTNSVTEIITGENASVEHLKWQDENQNAFHIATVANHFGRASNVVAHSFALGARLSRTNLYANLAGEGAECILNGLYLTRDQQLADHFMVVDHAVPHCASHEYFNGILGDASKGVFHGRIHVRPGAQKTDAKQTNKNLLLSDSATVDTKPQLEIYADDVKCTHGATIGQLNDESIFYLRARGIPLEKARRMLVHAFAGEIIERIRSARVREELDRLVWSRLEQNETMMEM